MTGEFRPDKKRRCLGSTDAEEEELIGGQEQGGPKLSVTLKQNTILIQHS